MWSATYTTFLVDYPPFEVNSEIEPRFSKWRLTLDFSTLNKNDPMRTGECTSAMKPKEKKILVWERSVNVLL